eukprot:3566633-Pyramimonas_sp.AAC.1
MRRCATLPKLHAKICDIHQCQFGSAHTKAARLAFDCCDELGCPFQSRCQGKHEVCSATGR